MAIPDEWQEVMHGWPGYSTQDLARLSLAAMSDS
jgi:hypothetical protein